jgi:LAO/AO transport system kinase
LINKEHISAICTGNIRAISRAISGIENENAEYLELLKNLSFNNTPVIGFTGPPGAGKSTLISACLSYLNTLNKRVAVIAVDPSSPFSKGALLGDRLRMNEHYLLPNVFIRSMATRGNLGGLSPQVFEVCDLLKAANFDYIFIETVGVGQSEVEIVALADTTVLVLVPEAGDEIQTIKSGIMEIADIFVLNKSDRSGADIFYKNLVQLAHETANEDWEIPVVQTIANDKKGIEKLFDAIVSHQTSKHHQEKKIELLLRKALQLITQSRTKDLEPESIKKSIKNEYSQNFNLYKFVKRYID